MPKSMRPLIDLSSIYEPHPRQILFHESTAKIKLFGGAIRGGKALTLDTPIFTTKGWKTMGLLKVGDYVFDSNGCPTRIIFKSDILLGNDVYEITFDCGEKIKADGEHQWPTMSNQERIRVFKSSETYKYRRRKPILSQPNKSHIHQSQGLSMWTLRTTAEMHSSYIGSNGSEYSIDCCKPLQPPDKKLPIDPYILGLWLGDGSKTWGSFTSADNEVVKAFEWVGYLPQKLNSDPYGYGTRGLRVTLRKNGLIKNKHIPKEYFEGSESQRRALLMGLMDTDGYCAEDGGCEFNNTNKDLSLGVLALARSLGIKCYFHEREAKLNGRYISQVYDVNFTTKQSVFKLTRKAERQNQVEKITQRRHYIKSIEKIESKPVQCITVDSPTHLYLAGKALIPTHNTKALVAEAIQLCLDYPGNVGIMARQTLPAFKRTVMVELERYLDVGVHVENDGRSDFVKLITQHHATDHFLQFYNGSRLWYTGLGDDDKGLVGQMGTTIGFGCIDQVEETSEMHFNNLLGRLSLPLRSIRYHMLLTANPMPGWVKQKFIENTPEDFIYIPSLPRDNPYLPPNYEQELRARYPRELAAAWLDGDWNVMESGNFLLSWNEITRAVDKEPPLEGELEMGVDFAWSSGDENVAVIRQGNKMLSFDRWVFKIEDSLKSVDRVIELINRHKIDPKNVKVDAVSGGSPMYSGLVEKGYPVIPIIAGARADDEEHYVNTRAEMYYQLQARFRENTISIVDDVDLKAQLSSIKYQPSAEKRLQIVSKEYMRKHGEKSPDRADALALAFYSPKKRSPKIRWL